MTFFVVYCVLGRWWWRFGKDGPTKLDYLSREVWDMVYAVWWWPNSLGAWRPYGYYLSLYYLNFYWPFRFFVHLINFVCIVYSVQRTQINNIILLIRRKPNYYNIIMPVPRRRNRKSGLGFQFSDIPSMAMNMFDANYIFQKIRIVLFYGFAPAIFYLGMTTEPRPQSWLEPFNILE